MEKKLFVIDGDDFTNEEEFYEEFSRVVIPGVDWGRNINSFQDVLRGGMGTPDEGFILVWKHSERSRQAFGYEATLDLWQQVLRNFSKGRSYEDFTRHRQRLSQLRRLLRNRPFSEIDIEQEQASYRYYEAQIELARRHEGETIFDWIMDCFRGGHEIDLRLE